MSIDARLGRLMPVLSARERGILVLRSLKEGTEEDPAWRRTMPQSQVHEFNRYIGLLNACNIHLSHLITFVEGEVEKLELRLSLWFVLRLWEMNLSEIEFAAAIVAREPITESDYRRLAKARASEYLPVQEVAELLAEHQRAWADEDLEQVGWSAEAVLKDEAWKRLCREAEGQIRQAVELEGVGSGRRLKIRAGSFDAWLGRPIHVQPAWAGGFDVRPDDQEARVLADRQHLQRLREVLETMPLARLSDHVAEAERTVPNLAETIQARVKGGVALRWVDLQIVEQLVEEIAAEFDGEDPLKPNLREVIEATKRKLEGIARQLEVYGEPVELREPTDEELEEMRAFVEKGRRLFS